MEEDTFKLLTLISKKEYFDFNKPIKSNRNIELENRDLGRNLKILLSKGFIIDNNNDTYSITDYGYNVVQHNSWKDYLQFQRDLINKQVKKDTLDLKISEFQVRTRNLPFIFSFIGIILSIIAISLSINECSNKRKQDKTHKQIEENSQQHKVFHTKKVDSTNP